MTAPHPPTARSGNDLRMLRAAVFAAVCVVLAAAGHTLASCAAVPLWSLGAGFLGAVLVVVPLAGRRRSLPGIVTLLALGQTALHALFGLGQHGTVATPVTASGGGAGALSDASLVQQAARLVCGTTAAAISPAQAERILTDARIAPDVHTGAAHHPADALSTAGTSASLLPSLPMLLGHLLAALAAGWLLRRGDLALARLVELSAHSAQSMAEAAFVRALRAALSLVRALHAGLAGAPGTGPRRPRPALWVPPRPRTTALQHTVIRRGPPSDAFALAA
ncbi:Integral membrane protein OS=Streptomyces tendae OX=1932 GN=GUR47_21405 PE=4 SV=1 [Streptomyces tendae]